MKKIGEGLQYKVYQKGDKVLKFPTSRIKILSKLLSWEPYLILTPRKLLRLQRNAIVSREEAVERFRNKKGGKHLLANPKFNEDVIEQDRVQMLEECIKESPEKYEKIVDDFIKLIFSCWRHGFSDKVFNLTINNGRAKNGEMVLVDFGELSFDKEEIIKDIKCKRWEKAHNFKFRLKGKIKRYYKEQMEKKVTIKNLNRYWKK